ncbi:hypothetical protein [Pseudomonas sivasensis]|uniref:IPT/TIG domain-containing protein n=1 Tax=Pseudomonas sivasensis TaxID=1880678 RepID=A0ABW8E327_9PSED
MSNIPPTIQTVDGSAVSLNGRNFAKRSFKITGTGFPGQLQVRFGATGSKVVDTITIAPDATFSATIMAPVPGPVTLTLTETDANPKEVSINLEVDKTIIENFEHEQLRYATDEEFVTKNFLKFRPHGGIGRSFKLSIEAMSRTNLLTNFIDDATREANFPDIVYSFRSPDPKNTALEISLRGKDDTHIKFNRMSFSYVSAGDVYFSWSDGTNTVPIKKATTGLDKFTFATSNMAYILVTTTPTSSAYFVAGKFELDPV